MYNNVINSIGKDIMKPKHLLIILSILFVASCAVVRFTDNDGTRKVIYSSNMTVSLGQHDTALVTTNSIQGGIANKFWDNFWKLIHDVNPWESK